MGAQGPAGPQGTAAPLASSVSAQTSFGLISSVGTAATCARADHTHGTPSLPVPGGDLGGTLAAATVTGLNGRAMSTTAPAVGDVLMFNGTTWAPVRAPLLVAAGVVSNRSTLGRSVGNLRVSAVTRNLMLVTFDGYAVPTSTRGYSIRVAQRGGTTTLLPRFMSFDPTGLVIGVFDTTGAEVTTSDVLAAALEIEVSVIL